MNISKSIGCMGAPGGGGMNGIGGIPYMGSGCGGG